ncbi:hypothetical protein [Acidianus brierleyi]|uniref:Uncharacterized protein n=1 Tax=Acidianus brierleyi TaxID=41673 RepID=A0A2U9IJ37_9CREN|nr:hypothetical protein [Acidianus brierleyi]AWR96049.1 hypothetical protein DFR85_13920 [Acidianus brierleyi]
MRATYPILIIVIGSIFTFLFLHIELYSSTQFGNSSVQTISPNLLKLDLELNSTSIKPGQSLQITTELYYMGESPYYVNVGKHYIRLPSPYPCGQNLLVGLEIFKGYYTTSNISNATPLYLYKPGIYFCPVILAATQYKLLPLSNQMQLIYNGKIVGTVHNEISISINGYWITNYTNPLSGKFTLFTPGIYTVEGISYFNQTVLEYFTVT